MFLQLNIEIGCVYCCSKVLPTLGYLNKYILTHSCTIIFNIIFACKHCVTILKVALSCDRIFNFSSNKRKLRCQSKVFSMTKFRDKSNEFPSKVGIDERREIHGGVYKYLYSHDYIARLHLPLNTFCSSATMLQLRAN